MSVKITDNTQAFLVAIDDRIETRLVRVGKVVAARAKALAPVKTGALRRSIHAEIDPIELMQETRKALGLTKPAAIRYRRPLKFPRPFVAYYQPGRRRRYTIPTEEQYKQMMKKYRKKMRRATILSIGPQTTYRSVLAHELAHEVAPPTRYDVFRSWFMGQRPFHEAAYAKAQRRTRRVMRKVVVGSTVPYGPKMEVHKPHLRPALHGSKAEIKRIFAK